MYKQIPVQDIKGLSHRAIGEHIGEVPGVTRGMGGNVPGEETSILSQTGYIICGIQCKMKM
jgi:hypothetical protein